MKFYVDSRYPGVYMYDVIKHTDKYDMYREYRLNSGFVGSYMQVRAEWFIRSGSHGEIKAERFNQKLIEAQMSKYVIATTLKSKILRAF